MENFFGRLLTKEERDPSVSYHEIAGMTELSAHHISCRRCGTVSHKKEVTLPVGAFYCPECINLGRVRSDEQLYHLPQQNFKAIKALKWSGQLTEYQAEISDQLVKAVSYEGANIEPSENVDSNEILVHAVTGAGKTEMIYAVIDNVLAAGGCVGIASPRIDVCIELHGRLSRDFDVKIPLLHGEGEPYFRSPLIIATTHQLLRFREAFDLLIVDEVDAFPFVDNDALYFAVEHARKPHSTLIYLTATSTDTLDKKVTSGKLTKLTLSHRFHGNPLVVPRLRWHTTFTADFKKQRATGFPLLIFMPEIEMGKSFASKLQKSYPQEMIGFVASTTKDRLNRVKNFRTGKLSILVTTTILERGVTFPCVDVFVVESQHTTFSKSALIQIAGRAGRSPERPTGTVYFYHRGRTKAMSRALKEIGAMNRQGGFSPREKTVDKGL